MKKHEEESPEPIDLGATDRELDLAMAVSSRLAAYPDRSQSNRLVTVGNCSFAFVCSKRWSELQADAVDSAKRFCEVCKKQVHWCNTPEEFARRGRAGECVAISRVENHESEHELLGMPGFEDDGDDGGAVY